MSKVLAIKRELARNTTIPELSRKTPKVNEVSRKVPTTPEFSRETPTIPEFFRDANVFVTGGSGFMGKVLLEKLLRSCPDIGKIYVLLRAKKGREMSGRIDDIIKQPLFDRLRQENPIAFGKLVAVSGDVTALSLGMRSEDQGILQDNVSVIFHTAASVRFDDSLRKAVITNVRGTREVIHLALGMKKLKVLVHVSTAYANCDRSKVFEKLYLPHGDWKKMIQMAEDDVNDQIPLTPKLLGSLPNTYTYAKSLTEHLIKDFEDRLPLVIFRPTIVVSTYKEPMPGWIDNFNGPAGLMAAGGTGVMRTLYGDPDYESDYVPVDTSIKAIIAAAWQRAVHSKPPSMPIYNCSSMIKPLKIKDIISTGQMIGKDYPLQQSMWLPNTEVTSIRAWYYFNVIVFHMLPALLVDAALMLAGRKRMLTKLQKRIYIANMTLSSFMFEPITFDNSAFLDLHSRLKTEDLDDFGFNEVVTDNHAYLTNCIIGAKTYLFKEKMEDLPKAKLHYRRLYWVDTITKTVSFLLVLWWVSSYFRYLFPQDS